MKLIQRLTLLSSIALLAGACDLQQTFDERIDDKQLLVLTPDFADTSVQLVFRDPETLAVIDEDFEVTVYANKRLVDLNGNYKNEFIARGGVMEFSVSPEETVSESDPLEISVYAVSENQTKIVLYHDSTVKKKGFNNIILTPLVAPNLDETQEGIQGVSQESKEIKEVPKSTEDPLLYLRINGVSFEYDPSSFRSEGYTAGYRVRIHPNPVFASSEATYLLYPTDFPLGDLNIEVMGPTFLDTNYKIRFVYFIGNKRYKANLDYTGNYTEELIYDGGYYLPRLYSATSYQLPNFSNQFSVPSSRRVSYLTLRWHPISQYRVCKDGFYIRFEGLESGDTASLLYRGVRDFDNETFMISAADISATDNVSYSLQYLDEHILSELGEHRLEFAENSQYIIEPSVIELGGDELCGNTYTVTLTRRDTHKMHNINLSMRNENQNVGVALTFSALLRKQGQSDAAWETVNFNQGSASVYLEEGSTYEVKLTLADEPFEFTFTNDLSLVEAAVQATKRNVSRIKDITYTIEQTAESNTIDAEIVFFEGQSLID